MGDACGISRRPIPSIPGSAGRRRARLPWERRLKITALETLRTAEFSNVLWVRVHTDAMAWLAWARRSTAPGAVESHIHDTLAGTPAGAATPCISRRLHREMLNLPMAQSSHRGGIPRGFGRGHRAVGYHSARSATNRCIRCSAWPVPAEAARLQYLRRLRLRPLAQHQARLDLELQRRRRAVRGPPRLHDPGRRRGRKPAGFRHHRDEDLAVRPGGDRRTTACRSRRTQLRDGHQRRSRKSAVPSATRWRSWWSSTRLWNLPMAKKLAKLAGALRARPGTRTRSA